MSLNSGRHHYEALDTGLLDAGEVDCAELLADAVYLRDVRLKSDGPVLKVERRKAGIPSALANHPTNPVSSVGGGTRLEEGTHPQTWATLDLSRYSSGHPTADRGRRPPATASREEEGVHQAA